MIRTTKDDSLKWTFYYYFERNTKNDDVEDEYDVLSQRKKTGRWQWKNVSVIEKEISTLWMMLEWERSFLRSLKISGSYQSMIIILALWKKRIWDVVEKNWQINWRVRQKRKGISPDRAIFELKRYRKVVISWREFKYFYEEVT